MCNIPCYSFDLFSSSSKTLIGPFNGNRRNVDNRNAFITIIKEVVNQGGGTASDVHNSRGLRKAYVPNQLQGDFEVSLVPTYTGRFFSRVNPVPMRLAVHESLPYFQVGCSCIEVLKGPLSLILFASEKGTSHSSFSVKMNDVLSLCIIF